MPLEDLRPTQVAVGMRAVAAKSMKIEPRTRKPRKLSRFLQERPIPAVKGPGNGVYIIDHHHLGRALWQSEVPKAYVSIIDDLSWLRRASFWRHMERQGCLYPYDEAGRRIEPSGLPRSLFELRDDPYRDLAWSVRKFGGFDKSETPYSEFFWAEFFRQNISRQLLKRDYDSAVAKAVKLAGSSKASDLPGFCGR